VLGCKRLAVQWERWLNAMGAGGSAGQVLRLGLRELVVTPPPRPAVGPLESQTAPQPLGLGPAPDASSIAASGELPGGSLDGSRGGRASESDTEGGEEEALLAASPSVYLAAPPDADAPCSDGGAREGRPDRQTPGGRRPPLGSTASGEDTEPQEEPAAGDGGPSGDWEPWSWLVRSALSC
jgi:hypothetical protein